jgi:glycine cleavage system aminomethyltransferase T
MAYVLPALAQVGRKIEVEIRGKRAGAQIVALPFYRRR